MKIVNFQQYIKACLKTAVYPQQPEGLYLKLGLTGEVGELCEKFKKLMRDSGWVPGTPIPDSHRTPIALELGDIMWYSAMMVYNDIQITGEKLSNLKKDIYDEFDPDVDNSEIVHLIDNLIQSSNSLCTIDLIHVNKDSDAFVIRINKLASNIRVNDFRTIFASVSAISNLCGFTHRQVCQMNVDKLASRLKRNKLHGSGDNR